MSERFPDVDSISIDNIHDSHKDFHG